MEKKSKIIGHVIDHALYCLKIVLNDSHESASDEFCFIIRLSTEFILETNYPSGRIIRP